MVSYYSTGLLGLDLSFCLRVYPLPTSKQCCRLQRASSGEYIREYRCERRVSFWSEDVFGFWAAAFEDRIGIWQILSSSWQFNIDCQTIDERMLLRSLCVFTSCQSTRGYTYLYEHMLSAFKQILFKIISVSDKFCRVYGSSILTVKQSKKGCYWISFLYSLLARVQDTPRHTLRTRMTKVWCQMKVCKIVHPR